MEQRGGVDRRAESTARRLPAAGLRVRMSGSKPSNRPTHASRKLDGSFMPPHELNTARRRSRAVERAVMAGNWRNAAETSRKIV